MTDPRYLDVTEEEMMADYYAHLYFDDPKAAEEDEDDDFNVDDVANQINANDPEDWETVG